MGKGPRHLVRGPFFAQHKTHPIYEISRLHPGHCLGIVTVIPAARAAEPNYLTKKDLGIMKSQARVVVIGGGVVGVSVLYHLTKRGWTDVMLVERSELTSGSTWHAAGGMHTINGDPNMSHLQAYTVKLYDELERRSGQSCGVHRVGCLYLAGTEARAEYFKTELAKAHYLGIGLREVSMDEVKKINPLVDTAKFTKAMFDPADGHVDPSSVTNAYAKAAKNKGATISLRNPVHRVEAEAQRSLAGRHQGRHDRGRICGECRRPVGARSGAPGRYRSAHPADGARIHRHQRDP